MEWPADPIIGFQDPHQLYDSDAYFAMIQAQIGLMCRTEMRAALITRRLIITNVWS
jgi:hypothetical protein